jgi:hypothetical protein
MFNSFLPQLLQNLSFERFVNLVELIGNIVDIEIAHISC